MPLLFWDEYADENNSVFFIDPPYTAGGKNAGKRLYTHYALDHDLLFQKCTRLKGDFIMTYNYAPEVVELAGKYNLQAKPVAMKNTHHAEMTELVIGKRPGLDGWHTKNCRETPHVSLNESLR